MLATETDEPAFEWTSKQLATGEIAQNDVYSPGTDCATNHIASFITDEQRRFTIDFAIRF